MVKGRGGGMDPGREYRTTAAARARNKRHYMKMIAEGRCVNCGKADDFTRQGRARCFSCNAKQHDGQKRKEMTREQRDRANADKREWERMRKEAHVCVACGRMDRRTVAGGGLCLRQLRVRRASGIRVLPEVRVRVEVEEGMTMKSIYIAGKMTGDSDYRTRFNAAESYLDWLGWIVVNPASLPKGLRDEAYMPVCIAMVNACDAVCLLKDGEDSAGAMAEVMFARRQGKKVFHGVDEVPKIGGADSE